MARLTITGGKHDGANATIPCTFAAWGFVWQLAEECFMDDTVENEFRNFDQVAGLQSILSMSWSRPGTVKFGDMTFTVTDDGSVCTRDHTTPPADKILRDIPA